MRDEGWQSKDNGDLLVLASSSLDILVTADQNLWHQQDLSKCNIAVVVLIARTNRLQDYEPLVPRLLEALKNAKAGCAVEVAA